MKLLVATRSAGKMREIRRILSGLTDVEVVDLEEAGIEYDPAEERLEPYETFEENAESKAMYFQKLSGLATVADDSGLEVDALGGGPGVRTKRFAPVADLEGQALDDANNAHLVSSLERVPAEARAARYVCVAAYRPLEGETVFCRGEAAGVVVAEPRGDGGFGYDPHIYDPTLGKTFAEMSPEEKDARSHRGAAFRALAAHLAGARGVNASGARP